MFISSTGERFETIEAASEFATRTGSVDCGVVMSLPQGGKMPLFSFAAWSRNVIRRLAASKGQES